MQKQTADEPGPQHLTSHAEDPRHIGKGKAWWDTLAIGIQNPCVTSMGNLSWVYGGLRSLHMAL